MPLTLTSLPVAELLKQETSVQHQASESLLMPTLNKIATRAQYAALLHTFYGFFHPLEQLITHYVGSDILPDIAERRNAALILQDLHALGFSTDALPQSDALPAVSSTAEALGALYVMEGSTLGGRVISRMLLKKEGLQLNEEHLRFFGGYGEATGSKWKAFVQLLNQQTGNTDTLIRSANETFRLFAAWIKKNSEA